MIHINTLQHPYLKVAFFWMCSILTFFMACKKDEINVEQIPLSASSYYPNSGKGGTLVTIEGAGFNPDLKLNDVKFAGVSGRIISVEADRMVVRAPEGGKSGELVISNQSGSLNVGNYTYQTLSISRVDPANGPAGSQIRIYGSGFGSMDEPAVVTINGKNALVGSANDTLLVVDIPVDAGSGPIEVQVEGMKVRGQDFNFQAIASAKPLSGAKGTKVRITGEGFETLVTGNLVDFNGKRAQVLEAAAGSLLVEVPEGISTGPLSVTVNGQRAIGPIFTLVDLPGIVEVSPLSGPSGSIMTIKGSRFSSFLDENKVFINGVEVAVTSASSTELKLTIPGGTGSGKVTVVVNDQQADGPQFKDQHLGILDISPDNGLTGTTVSITGSGFDTDVNKNIVTFNGVVAQVTAATANKLTVRAPSGLSSGILRVAVDGQEATAPREFRRAGISTLTTTVTSNSITVDQDGNLYAIDNIKQEVVKFNAVGQISVLATGFSFSSTSAIVVDQQKNLYVSEAGKGTIKKISPSGIVSNLVNNVGPIGKMMMQANQTIIAIIGNSSLVRFKLDGTVQYLSPVSPIYMDINQVQFGLDDNDGIYYANNIEYPAISYNPVTTQEDYSQGFGDGEYGAYKDGIGRNAQFSGNFGGIIPDKKGNLLVADSHYIRSINLSSRAVGTFFKTERGDRDGSLQEGTLNAISSFAIGTDGTLFIAQSNGRIRKVFFK